MPLVLYTLVVETVVFGVMGFSFWWWPLVVVLLAGFLEGLLGWQ